MRKNVVAALSVAAVLSGATFATSAVAMPLAPQPFLRAANSSLLERVTNICGINGCAPIHVKRMRKPPPDFVKRAAPLVFPIASAAPKQPVQK